MCRPRIDMNHGTKHWRGRGAQWARSFNTSIIHIRGSATIICVLVFLCNHIHLLVCKPFPCVHCASSIDGADCFFQFVCLCAKGDWKIIEFAIVFVPLLNKRVFVRQRIFWSSVVRLHWIYTHTINIQLVLFIYLLLGGENAYTISRRICSFNRIGI